MTSRKAAQLGALAVICCFLILPFSHARCREGCA